MGLFDSLRIYFTENVLSRKKVQQDDNVFYDNIQNSGLRDRAQGNFYNVIEDSLMAWRDNPLARRIVNLQTQYVIGEGIAIECEDEHALQAIRDFWDDPLNHMDIRVSEWCDELTRTGNLFIILSSDLSGKTYVRAVPATSIQAIETMQNDYEQALWFEYTEQNQMGMIHIEAESELLPTLDPRMMQFTVNRPIGAKLGEPDLAPVLVWLKRYSMWLEDRARLNHYRNSFLFTVKTQLRSEGERKRRQDELNSRPFTPGSVLVTNESEVWDVLSAKLESSDAANDGLALKKQIASGVGIPLHFLAEPESQNKASAEAAGGATYRTFEQRQQVFLWIVSQVVRAVLRRRRLVDHELNAEADFRLVGADIYEQDNNTLSTAAATMTNVVSQLRKYRHISRNELLRLVYKFAGEDPDTDAVLKAGADDPWTETETMVYMSAINNANGEEDTTKYNTTTVPSDVKHYDQGAEVN